MEKRIITISREFGSGGRFIGEETAKKLGIAYYDKNIINLDHGIYCFRSLGTLFFIGTQGHT